MTTDGQEANMLEKLVHVEILNGHLRGEERTSHDSDGAPGGGKLEEGGLEEGPSGGGVPEKAGAAVGEDAQGKKRRRLSNDDRSSGKSNCTDRNADP